MNILMHTQRRKHGSDISLILGIYRRELTRNTGLYDSNNLSPDKDDPGILDNSFVKNISYPILPVSPDPTPSTHQPKSQKRSVRLSHPNTQPRREEAWDELV